MRAPSPTETPPAPVPFIAASHSRGALQRCIFEMCLIFRSQLIENKGKQGATGPFRSTAIWTRRGRPPTQRNGPARSGYSVVNHTTSTPEGLAGRHISTALGCSPSASPIPVPQKLSPRHPNLKPRFATRYLRDASNYFSVSRSLGTDARAANIPQKQSPRIASHPARDGKSGTQRRTISIESGASPRRKTTVRSAPSARGQDKGTASAVPKKNAPRSGFHAHARAPGFSRCAFCEPQKPGILQIGCERAIPSEMPGRVARDRPGAFCPAYLWSAHKKRHASSLAQPPVPVQAVLLHASSLTALGYSARFFIRPHCAYSS